MLDDDDHLLQTAIANLEASQAAMRDLFRAVLLIHKCLKHTQTSKKTSVSDLSVRALSGDLGDSALVEDMLASVKAMDSEQLFEVLDILPKNLSDEAPLAEIQNDLKSLMDEHPDSRPFHSEYNINNSVTTTTVVHQRVKLTKGKANLRKQDVEYNKIIDRLAGALIEYFSETLIQPTDLFMNEAFLFDLRNPLKEVFTPRPRFAIERALAAPFDYLISSSPSTESKISAKQPPASILYQLYLESGALVNVHDLWQAFYAVFDSSQGDKCDERVVMALFYGALSDLKTFGMIKNSRKKTDHLAKSNWVGL